jgi:lysophospholipase L1-like esterase
LGVTVNVDNRAISGQRASELLRNLKNSQKLRDASSEAEVITIWTGWNDRIAWTENPWIGSFCGSGENVDLDCVRKPTTALLADIDGILVEVPSLRNTDDTLIRIADNANFLVDEWKDAGVFEKLKDPGFEDWSQGIVDVAAKHNVPVVHSYAALNGPNGDDAIAEEYLLTDGLHFTTEGHILISDLHRELGYEFTGP